jgi:hypothetical protein
VHDAVVPIGVPMRARFASPEPGARLSVRVGVAEVLDTEGNVAASAATLRVVPP